MEDVAYGRYVLSPSPFIESWCERFPARRGHEIAVKRVLDVTVAALGLVVLSPVLATVALLVRVASRGPVLYRQTRVGKGGLTFSMLKFRTMCHHADSLRESLRELNVYDDPRLFKVSRDPRVTRLGYWLRKTSLDELPQLVNVLRGEMSLVGPRPPLPEEVAFYVDRDYARLSVLPGMTGPWQVAGRNLITDFDQVVSLELRYLESWSLANDLRILAETVPAVLRMRGAR
jgi:lipopolysaccharide/colanic/teichoic acid biosynthesis glycosyltransferase